MVDSLQQPFESFFKKNWTFYAEIGNILGTGKSRDWPLFPGIIPGAKIGRDPGISRSRDPGMEALVETL